jgi:hypothetical protein
LTAAAIVNPVWGRKPVGRRQELTKRGRVAQGVVVHTWRGSRLVDGNRFTRAYAEVAYQTPWGRRTATVRGVYQAGDAVRMLYDEQGAMRAPD